MHSRIFHPIPATMSLGESSIQRGPFSTIPEEVIFWGHEPLDALLLADAGRLVVVQDPETRLRGETASFREAYLWLFERLLSNASQDWIPQKEFVANPQARLEEGRVRPWVVPYTYVGARQEWKDLVDQVDAYPYRRGEFYRLLSVANRLDDNLQQLEYLKRVVPDYVIPDSWVLEPGDNEMLRNLLSKYGAVVQKKRQSGGGVGLSVIRDLLSRTSGSAIFQPLISAQRSSSTTCFISDDYISMLFMSDQILEGFSYRGNRYPSVSSAPAEIEKATCLMTQAMQAEGFRGFCNFDFLESQGKIYVCEINPRVPYSLYPYALAIRKGWNSFTCFQRSIPASSFSPKTLEESISSGKEVFFLRQQGESVLIREIWEGRSPD